MGRNTCPEQLPGRGIKTKPASTPPARSGQQQGLWQRHWGNPAGTNPQRLLNPSHAIITPASRRQWVLRRLPSCARTRHIPSRSRVPWLLLATTGHQLQTMAHVCRGQALCRCCTHAHARTHRCHRASPLPTCQAGGSPTAAAAGVDDFLPSPRRPLLVSIINHHGSCRQP